jgi:hypothetical protein
MSRLPGIYRGQRLQTTCPYRSDHRLPNGGWIPGEFVAGTGELPLDEDEPEEAIAYGLRTVILTCMLGHQWNASDPHWSPSDAPRYTPPTTDKAD